ncbi:DUF4238 domain-containing protein [Raoultella ornithinolytica]|uniref:DUF4238 domain-containing protein n=1 Tax=Klebsiella/Raoultella group TaxID=2890311 RepID=UPI000DE6A545|nr:DUF4238 domain-containing protein [Klebsiella pneumoniae]EKQ8001237.1 DUF4238 domain-containing protein [Raoultella ornithinolytica]HDS7134777.1 DUF4238 domain-containing protein [Klebsiella aerogenes]EKU0199889.1 DUF4238 domain-containing protein [Raoultella ornithinolytica]EKV0508707.1 DUF4238 domain-containing protein [Raoultella ornithinolytica]EKV4103557.1 DUF4238 domain-containing protein [Raoultella ornithinolytica]
MAEPINLQTDVVRQHTVPRFLLKHFSTPGKGKRLRLYAFDKAAGRAYATTPDDATVRNTFYNLDDHPQRLSLEPLLGIYEHEAAPVIADLLRHKDIRQLTADDRYKLAVFVAVQRARTFGELERISGMISVLFSKMAAMGATEEQAGETLGLSPGGDNRDVFLRQLVQQISHIDHLLNKDWYLLETKPEHPFYVSDNPVVLENRNDFGPYGNIGLAVLGIQIYLPLSSTLMLAMYCPSIREQKIRDKQDLHHLLARAPHLIPRHMRPFEMLRHLSRFTDYHLMPLTADHVTHYNALQVEYAEQYVFCGENDFSLVERMLADDDRYRTGPRFTF